MLLRADVLSAVALPIGLGLIIHASTLEAPLPTVETVQEAPDVSFAEQILPIFEARCGECHSDSSAELGLNLATYENAMQGSDYGSVIEPGNADGSLLLDMIISGDMPDGADKLPDDEIALIRQWIDEGAQNN